MAFQQNMNIKVCCRIRGQNEEDKRALDHSYSFPDEKSMLHLPSDKVYTFDQIFDQNSSQEQVYNDVARPIVTSVLAGFNGTILAYGQTSSGKTYTMEGDVSDNDKLGIIPRVAHDIFSRTESLDDKTKSEIKISYYEIYLEKVIDLLSNSTKGNLFVYEDKKRMPFISGLKEVTVKNVQELMEFFTEAKLKRHVSETDLNKMSSRSHTVFQIVIKQENSAERKRITGKLLLIDLAGSERACQRDVSGSVIRRESSYINKSLSVLSRVIFVLTSNTKDLPPYRESCLTRLLKESLGGNSQTAIIVCIRPSSECETKYSLEFGTRAKIIRNSLQLNVKLSGNRLSRFWDRLQRSIRSTNKYIKGSVTELQRWRSGESVPEEEWIPLFDYGEGDSFSESALLDTSDCAHYVQNMSNSQILSDSSIMNTSSSDINSSSTLQDCEDISGLIRQVEIMKKQFQQLSLGNTKSKHVKSEEANNTDERQADEMIKLKEELAFYKERNLIHHQGMETVTQELKLQEIRFNELSSKLIAEIGKSEMQEAKAERRMRDIRRCGKVLDEYLEVFSKKNSQKSIACSLKPLSEICPSIDDKLRRITGEDLKSTLHAENIQDQIFRMYFKLQGMTNFRVEQEQKIATVTSERDSAIENNMSLQEELYNLSISHAAMGQALKVSMVDKLQHLKIEGLQESLFEGCVQNGVMKLCDQLIGLYEKCDQQEKKIAAISEERDILGQSLVFAGIDMDNLRKTHESEKKLSDAKIDSMSDEIETLHLELEKERSRGSHCSYINHRLREENEANEVKINSLEEELFTERVLNEEETSRMELLLLEKANAESLLAARLCCSDKRNQIIVEEFKKRVGDLMVLFKNFLDKFNVPPFDDADLEENAVVEGNTTFVKNGSSEDLNNNEVLTSDLFLDKTSTEEVHFETLSGSFSGNAEPSPGIKETGEVTENFKVEELVLDSEWYRPVW